MNCGERGSFRLNVVPWHFPANRRAAAQSEYLNRAVFVLLIGTASGRLVPLSAAASRPRSLSPLGGWVPGLEEPPDWQLHMCRCNYGLANWQRGNAGTLSLLTHRHNLSRTCRWEGEWRDGGLGETSVGMNVLVCGKVRGRKMEGRLSRKASEAFMWVEGCCYFSLSFIFFFCFTQPLLCIVPHQRLAIYLAIPTSVTVAKPVKLSILNATADSPLKMCRCVWQVGLFIWEKMTCLQKEHWSAKHLHLTLIGHKQNSSFRFSESIMFWAR